MLKFYEQLNKKIYQESLNFETQLNRLINYAVSQKKILVIETQPVEIQKLRTGIETLYRKKINSLFDLGQIHALKVKEPLAQFNRDDEFNKVFRDESGTNKPTEAEKLRYFQQYLNEQSKQISGKLVAEKFPSMPKTILDNNNNASEILKAEIQKETEEYLLKKNKLKPQEKKEYFDKVSKLMGLASKENEIKKLEAQAETPEEKAQIEKLKQLKDQQDRQVQKVIVTELRAAYSVGKIYSYAAQGYTSLIWNASAEHLAFSFSNPIESRKKDKPCKVCLFMHGKKVTISSVLNEVWAINPETQSPWVVPLVGQVKSFLPTHPYCACSYIPDPDSRQKNKIVSIEDAPKPTGDGIETMKRAALVSGGLLAALGGFVLFKLGAKSQLINDSQQILKAALEGPAKDYLTDQITKVQALPEVVKPPKPPEQVLPEIVEQVLPEIVEQVLPEVVEQVLPEVVEKVLPELVQQKTELLQNIDKLVELVTVKTPKSGELPQALKTLKLETFKEVLEVEKEISDFNNVYKDVMAGLYPDDLRSLENTEYILTQLSNSLTTSLLNYDNLEENIKFALLQKIESFTGLDSVEKGRKIIEVNKLKIQNKFISKKQTLDLMQSIQNNLADIRFFKKQQAITQFDEEQIFESILDISPKLIRDLEVNISKVSGKYNSYLTTPKFKNLENKINGFINNQSQPTLSEVKTLTQDLKTFKQVINQSEQLLNQFPTDLPSLGLTTSSPRVNKLLKDYEKANETYKQYSKFYNTNAVKLDSLIASQKTERVGSGLLEMVKKKQKILERYNQDIIPLLQNPEVSSKVRDSLSFIYSNLVALNYNNYKPYLSRINRNLKELPNLAQTEMDNYVIQALSPQTQLGSDLTNIKAYLELFEFNRYNINNSQFTRLLTYVRKFH